MKSYTPWLEGLGWNPHPQAIEERDMHEKILERRGGETPMTQL